MACVIVFFVKAFFNLIALNRSFPGCGTNDKLISKTQHFWLNIVNWAAFITLNEIVIGLHLFLFGFCVLLFLKQGYLSAYLNDMDVIENEEDGLRRDMIGAKDNIEDEQ